MLLAVATKKDETTGTDAFKELLSDITLQITAASPDALDRTQLDQSKLEKEREIAREQFKDKPAQAIEKRWRARSRNTSPKSASWIRTS